jgi:DNA-binding SARP family transcriptional activator
MSDLVGVVDQAGSAAVSPYERLDCCDDPRGLPGVSSCAEGSDRRGDARDRVRIRLLDGFEVLVEGAPDPAGRWTKRSAAALVKLLALSPRGRLHRDRVVDALWPDSTLDAALPRLHKAAHHARRELGHRDAVVLRDQVVALFPHARLEVDAIAFEVAADAALSTKPLSASACDEALRLAGELLPEDLAECWLDEPRQRLRLRVEQLLQDARRWQDLLRMNPAHEEAHVELLREAVATGDRTNGLRRFVLMERALDAELGIPPGREATALLQRLVAS